MTRTKEIKLLLAEPRGFCAGVRRAINIVENALQKYGPPIYIRHEIVHNKHVIEELKNKGAVFVEGIEEIPESSVVILSAHGVGLDVIKQAKEKHLTIIDATCPLVEKVHRQIQKYAAQNFEIIVIGKSSHPEIIGTLGQIPDYKRIHVINSIQEAKKIQISANVPVGFVTQTTLSVDDTQEIINVLKTRFSEIEGLQTKDICYATTNRQNAIKKIAPLSDCVFVLGSKNSSNSKQLRDVALKNNAPQAYLIDDVTEIDWNTLDTCHTFGISAGASAPEYLVEELIDEFKSRYHKINIQDVIIAKENINFRL